MVTGCDTEGCKQRVGLVLGQYVAVGQERRFIVWHGDGFAFAQHSASRQGTDHPYGGAGVGQQGQAGALLNRLESAQRVQETAATAMDRSVAQMESADISVEAYHLTRDRLRSEAANATLARAFTYQRDMSRSLIGLIGGGFSGVG